MEAPGFRTLPRNLKRKPQASGGETEAAWLLWLFTGEDRSGLYSRRKSPEGEGLRLDARRGTPEGKRIMDRTPERGTRKAKGFGSTLDGERLKEEGPRASVQGGERGGGSSDRKPRETRRTEVQRVELRGGSVEEEAFRGQIQNAENEK
jgi:hypothetical protein